MTTMDEKYGDGSKCLCCTECGLCIEHGDCKADGCGKEVGKPDPRQVLREATGYTWTAEIPDEEGVFWFYGYRYGKISVGREQEKVLALVRVHKDGSGNCMMVSEGTFMFKSELEEPMFIKTKLPTLPKL